MGGEYLFAFDQRECSERLSSVELADPSGPFFVCMRDRGYLRVDLSSGELLDAPGPVVQTASARNASFD